MAVERWSFQTEQMETLHEGHVLSVSYNVSVRVMSDVWGTEHQALVWSEVNQCPMTVAFAGSEWGKHQGDAMPDATPEVMNAYYKWAAKDYYDRHLSAALVEAKRPAKGKTLTVVSGKTAKGATGKCFAEFEGTYNAGPYSRVEMKYGIALSDKMEDKVWTSPNGKYTKTFQNPVDKAWVWGRNVEVVNPEQYVDQAAIFAAAKAFGRSLVEKM